MPLSCDVVVVGGGPAGSSCAWALRRAGLDVVVLDRSSFPRHKVCAGWITPPVVTTLALDLDEYRQGRVLQPLCIARTARMGEPVVETRYGEPVSYGIRRVELDDYLLRRSGARLRTGEAAFRLERRNAVWRVNDAIEAPMLVGAGGHFCPVARRLGGGGAAEPIVAAQESEIVLSPEEQAACAVPPGTVEIRFSADLAGYGWWFRKGDYLNVGYGRQGARELREHARRFVEHLRREGGVPESALRAWKGHAYLLYPDRARPLVADGVVLVGDAAGLAYAQSGEGIRTAVESGILAARAIVDARGDYQRARLRAYEDALRERFGPPGAGAAGWLPPSWRAALGGRLLASPWLTRRVVLDRWFFHRRQPALVA